MTQKDESKEELIEQIRLLQKQIAELEISDSERKLAEIYLKTMFDSIQAGVILIDPESHRIVEVNPTAINMFGMPKENIVGSICYQFVCPAEVGKCPITDLCQTVDNSERVLLNAKGERIPIIKTVVSVALGGRRYLLESFIDITERKKAEECIKKQNEFVGTVINSLQYPFYVIGTDYTIILSNKAAKKRGVVEGDRCYQLTHRCQEPCSNEHICPLKEVIRTRKPVVTEHIHFDNDGNCRNFEVHGDPILDKDGQVIQMIEYSIDITKRKQAEEALRESKRLLSQAQELAHIGSWKFTPVIGKTVWSEEMFRIYGFEPANEAPPFGVLAEMVHREDRQTWGETIDKARHTGVFYNLEYRIIRPDGQCRWLLAHESSQPASKDTPLVFYGTVLDITERKLVEDELRKSESRYRLLADNATDIIWTSDMNLSFTYFSPCVMQVLGYTAEEMLTKRIEDFLTPGSIQLARRVLLEEIAKDSLPGADLSRSRLLELQHIRKDGTIIWVEIKMSFLRDQAHRPMGILGITRDITERKKAEVELQAAYASLKKMQEQLIQAEKLEAIGRLASGIAHEVRNPLGTILQSVDYLEDKIPSGQKEILQMIKDNIKRADNIIRTLVDFSKATQLNLLAEDINPVLEASLVLIQPRIRLENIELIKELEEGLPKVLIDKIRIEQVFVNILINAVEAMPQGGKLYIRTYKKQLSEPGFRIGRRKNDGDYFQPQETIVVAEIEDIGTGISEDNLKEIFEPFFTTKGPDRGTGLGLSVTKNIIDLHKGLIDVKSKVGEGTKVIISLKVAKEGRHG